MNYAELCERKFEGVKVQAVLFIATERDLLNKLAAHLGCVKDRISLQHDFEFSVKAEKVTFNFKIGIQLEDPKEYGKFDMIYLKGISCSAYSVNGPVSVKYGPISHYLTEDISDIFDEALMDYAENLLDTSAEHQADMVNTAKGRQAESVEAARMIEDAVKSVNQFSGNY